MSERQRANRKYRVCSPRSGEPVIGAPRDVPTCVVTQRMVRQ